MTDNVIRFSDYERRSRNPDAVQPRDPASADVIILPCIQIERQAQEFVEKLDRLMVPWQVPFG